MELEDILQQEVAIAFRNSEYTTATRVLKSKIELAQQRIDKIQKEIRSLEDNINNWSKDLNCPHEFFTQGEEHPGGTKLIVRRCRLCNVETFYAMGK